MPYMKRNVHSTNQVLKPVKFRKYSGLSRLSSVLDPKSWIPVTNPRSTERGFPGRRLWKWQDICFVKTCL